MILAQARRYLRRDPRWEDLHPEVNRCDKRHPNRGGVFPGGRRKIFRWSAPPGPSHLRDSVGWSDVELLAERLDLDLAVNIGALSHGNRRKLGLVQAFMHKPEPEPT